MDFNVCVIAPAGYVHSQAFSELAEAVCFGLQDLGHSAQLSLNNVLPNSRNIIIGCHLLNPAAIKVVPKSTVIINTEPIEIRDSAWNSWIHQWAANFETWDYSRRNFDQLTRNGARNPKELNLGFHPRLARIAKRSTEDIDVLFYGSVNDRRRKILEDLQQSGRKIVSVFGVYGAERDDLIARSKVVLSLHTETPGIFEVVRAFYLLANKKAVVGEVNPDTQIDPRFRDAIVPASYDELVATCLRLVEDDDTRRAVEARGFEMISQMPQGALLAPLIGTGTRA